MKLARYIIELIVTATCGYCAYYLLSVFDTWKGDDSIFYIFAIIFMICIGIVCVCDIIESIYYSHK